jgi:hypothetical protein
LHLPGERRGRLVPPSGQLLCLRYDGVTERDSEAEFHFEDVVMGTPLADIADEVDLALADYDAALKAFEARRPAGSMPAACARLRILRPTSRKPPTTSTGPSPASRSASPRAEFRQPAPGSASRGPPGDAFRDRRAWLPLFKRRVPGSAFRAAGA